MVKKCDKKVACSIEKKAQEEVDELYKKQVNLKDVSKEDIILDVRSHGEHSEVALKQSHYLIELNKLDPKKFIKDYGIGKKKIHLLCASGHRATQAALKFEAAGYENIDIISGGISEIKANKLEKSAVFSLERQTRIGVGSLILLSLLLGHFASDYFYLASAFFACGLIYAGLTNFCGLAMLLSKMPWNNK
ncbi:MAG: rhodanese-like domain-containing protein [Alphaproteobacteria bacterium]|nr:rhodanese-like domain-containing protein [Alphaproteobacteria bacterium]